MKLNEYGPIIWKCWNEIPNHFSNVQCDEFIIMPNHVHGILFIQNACRGGVSPPSIAGRGTPAPTNIRPNLGKIIAYFKYQCCKLINKTPNTPGFPVWQRNYYEHIIRNERKLYDIRNYILENPIKWQLDPENPAVV